MEAFNTFCDEIFSQGLTPSLSVIAAREGKVIFKTPAFKVNSIDTTGAGDVFHGAYIYGLIKGKDIRRTVEFASAFAALKCLRPGGREGIPTLEETLKLINSGEER